MAYQQYLNNNFGRNVLSYRCQFSSNVHKMLHYNKSNVLQISDCSSFFDTKAQAMKEIYPYTSKSRACTLMMITNLAEPEWISVNCEAKIFYHVLCITRSDQVNSATHTTVRHPSEIVDCPMLAFVDHNTCLIFVWHDHNLTNDIIPTSFGQYMKLTNISMFEYIFNGISEPFPMILSLIEEKETIILRFSYERVLNLFIYKQENISVSNARGFHVFTFQKSVIALGLNWFVCRSGEYISVLFVCSGIVDCQRDSSDEEGCRHYKRKYNTPQHYIPADIQEKISGMCPFYFSMTISGICQKDLGHTRNHTIYAKDSTYFVCNNGLKVDMTMKDDLVADCGPKAEDEPKLIQLLTFNASFSCQERYQVQCRKGHSKCFNISDICKYQLDSRNNLIPCRTGGHVQNCKGFSCNLMYKCSN